MAIESENCPKCSASNWYDNGDTSDFTQCDIEALECWKCGAKFWLSGAEEVRTTLLQSLNFDGPDSVFIEKGAKTPNEAAYGGDD